MHNALAVLQPTEIIITDEQKNLVKRTVAPDATDAELELFFYDCRRRGTHPLDKMIHFTKRGGKYTPVTSIDMFRMRASESGDHAGTQDAVYKGDPATKDFEASVTVYKLVSGEKCPFTATARWAEYFPGEQQGFMWRRMPHLMLAKCAEALALRKAFPGQLHGLYTNEEMAQAEPVQHIKPTIPTVRPQGTGTLVQAERESAPASEVVPPAETAVPPGPAGAPLPSVAEYAKEIAQRHTSEYETAEGFVGTHTPPFKGRNGKMGPGKLIIETISGPGEFQYWASDRPDGIGDAGNTYCRIAYETSEYNGKTQKTIKGLEWIEAP